MRRTALAATIALAGALGCPATAVRLSCDLDEDCPNGAVCAGAVCVAMADAGVTIGEGEGEGDIPPRCGDGVRDSDEQCDDGNLADGDACDGNCTVPGCGNGRTVAPELCDDGNVVSGDGCDADCTLPGCGNGEVSALEECDDGNANGGDGCDPNCRFPRCGNGFVGGIETCDDGNQTSGDGCDALCFAELCGNAITQAGEACDDGNDVNGDYCDNNCTVPRCGNGALAVDDGEECDDANATEGDGCDTNCTETRCGNGLAVAGVEECDLGDEQNGNEPGDLCRADCTTGCGDGVVDAFEQCDGEVGCTQCRWGTRVCVVTAASAVECYLDIDVVAHGAPERTAPPATGASAADPYLHDVTWGCTDMVDTESTIGASNRASICGVTMDVNTSVSDVLVYTMRSLTLGASANVRFVGDRNVVLVVYGDVTIAAGARLGVDGVTTNPGAGARADCGAPTPTGSDGGGAGGSHGSLGGNGGNGDGDNGSAAVAVSASDPHVTLERGCRGGHGGDGPTQTDGGAPGGALQISAGGTVTIDGTLSSNGGAGTRTGDSDGGGSGGGSGGDLYVQAARVVIGTGASVVAQGGGGSGGGEGDPGETAPTDPAERASGGSGGNDETAGGAGAGAAADGVVDEADPGVSATGPAGSHGAGGGGGGVGRISMDLQGACPTTPHLRFSPQPACR